MKGDIIVSETLGCFALEEHLIENMEDAKRFVSDEKNVVFIPSMLEQFVCPVIGNGVYNELNSAFSELPLGIDLMEAKYLSFSKLFQRTIPTSELYQEAKDSIQCWDTMQFNPSQKNNSVRQSKRITWSSPTKQHTVFGFAIWWKAELGSGTNVSISTSPFEKSTHWEQAFLPMRKPLQWNVGNKLGLQIKSDTSDLPSITWDVFHADKKIESGGL